MKFVFNRFYLSKASILKFYLIKYKLRILLLYFIALWVFDESRYFVA